MPVVYLIRHGQASYGGANYDVLSERGQAQSELVGCHFLRSGIGLARVISGTMRRQIDTAAIFLKEFCGDGDPMECAADARWNEMAGDAIVTHYGPAELTMGSVHPRVYQDHLDKASRQWIADLDPPGAFERWSDFDARVWAALDQLLSELAAGQAAAVFTSGGAISALVARLLDTSSEGYLALHRASVNAAVTKVVRGHSGTTLISFNDHGHLESPTREMVTHT